MEGKKRSRRRQSMPKTENYYKILGVRHNASQDEIKKKYIESVKAFPPETHPEEFQRIRRAYETLRDPARRSEYDLMRKYGGKLDKIMEEAFKFMEAGQWSEAARMFRQAVKISPDNIHIRLGLAYSSLQQGDGREFEEQTQFAVDMVPENEKALVLAQKARILLEAERAEEALEVLENTRAFYPEQFHLLRGVYVEVYRELGREEELWAMAQSMIPPEESQSADDIYIFILWINTMIDLEKWNVWSGIHARVRKFLKSVRDEEDRIMILSALQIEHDEYLEAGCFREAELYIDLIYFIDKNNPAVQRQRRETQELARVDKEIKRMRRDYNILPSVLINAIEWLYREYLPEDIKSLREGIPPFLLQETDEDLAQSIAYLRKKYPLVYRRFQDQWDDIFDSRNGGVKSVSKGQS